MSAIKAVVLTASVDNEDALRSWVASVGEAAQEVQAALDALTERLRDAPHISITLTQHPEAKP